MMETLEDDLLTNRFPYPQYYDGKSWNTIIYNSRKSVPDYLQSTLPNMKYQKVKEKFQEMNKFSPPQITYFQKMIKTSRTPRRSIQGYRQKVNSKKRKADQVQHLREQLQYALIMTNRNSKVLIDIVEKVSNAERQLKVKNTKDEGRFQEKLVRTKKSQSLDIGKSTQDCFKNTVDIVFSLRKKEYASKLKQKQQPEFKEQIRNKVNSIRLKTFNIE